MRCPACDGTTLSKPHTVRIDGCVVLPDVGKSYYVGAKELYLYPSAARICTQCGYLMLFMSGEDIETVKAKE